MSKALAEMVQAAPATWRALTRLHQPACESMMSSFPESGLPSSRPPTLAAHSLLRRQGETCLYKWFEVGTEDWPELLPRSAAGSRDKHLDMWAR